MEPKSVVRPQVPFRETAKAGLVEKKPINGVGPWSTEGQAHTMIFINDPVAQSNYVLDGSRHTANKMPSPRVAIRHMGPGGDVGASDAASSKIRAEKLARAVNHEADQANLKTESLGTQTIAGVAAVGTRHTRTIPAGKIGNDRPIDIVSETWYSQELQMVVMSKHTIRDPVILSTP